MQGDHGVPGGAWAHPHVFGRARLHGWRALVRRLRKMVVATTREETNENPRFVRPEGCICLMFTDIGERRIADLTCPVHGVDGSDPGDGFWEVKDE